MANVPKIGISKKPLSHLNQLASIEEAWREIYEASCPNSTFLCFDYIMLWYNCFAKPEQVRVYTAIDEGKIIGFLPLVLNKKGPFRTLISLANEHCSQPVPLIKGGYEKIFYKNCFDAILSDKHSWDILQYFAGYSFQQDPNLQKACLRKYHFNEHIEPTYSILLPDTFDEYFNHHLSANMRKNAKRLKNKLKKFSTYNFHHYIGDEALAYWPTFLSIEDSGWKGNEDSSIKRLPQNFQMYYEGLISMLTKNNQIHLYFLEVNGKAISGAFCYLDQGVFHYAKIGYIEEYSPLAPSNLLLLFIIEDLINNLPSVKRFHMFRLDYGYKHKYTNEKTFCSEITLYGPTMRGNAACFFSVMKEGIKLFPGAITFVKKVRKWLGRKAI